VSKISQIENHHIETLQKNKRELVERHSSGIFNIGEEKVIKEIYKNKNVEAISGKDADQLYKKRINESKKRDSKISKLIESYEEIIRDITEKMVELKNSVYESFAKGVEFKSSMISEESRLIREQRSSLRSMCGERSMS
jgi:nitrogen-specific signal transduction histidine kinase